MKTQDRESVRYNNQRKRINRIRFIMENWHQMTIKQRIKYFLRYSSGIYIHVTGKLFVDLFIQGFNSAIAEIKSRRQIDEDDQILH